MSQISRKSDETLRPTHESNEPGAAHSKPAVRTPRKTRIREGKELSLATLTVIGALSLGAVGGLAYMTEGRDAPPPATPSVAPKAVQPPAAPVKTAEAKPNEAPKTAPAPAENAEAKVKPVETPVRRLPEEPIRTASISPAVPLPPLVVPSRLPGPEPAAKPPAPVVAPPAEAVKPPTPKRPTISQEEAEGYLAKAETALRSGDLTVARSFFGRLAQGGDPRGALGMARTYDEAELRNLPVFGLKPDRAEAERWRQRAREMTSAFAKN
jgi:hypothetical protein